MKTGDCWVKKYPKLIETFDDRYLEIAVMIEEDLASVDEVILVGENKVDDRVADLRVERNKVVGIHERKKSRKQKRIGRLVGDQTLIEKSLLRKTSLCYAVGVYYCSVVLLPNDSVLQSKVQLLIHVVFVYDYLWGCCCYLLSILKTTV